MPLWLRKYNLAIDGQPKPSGALNILADFVFGTDAKLSGVFVFEKTGILAKATFMR